MSRTQSGVLAAYKFDPLNALGVQDRSRCTSGHRWSQEDAWRRGWYNPEWFDIEVPVLTRHFRRKPGSETFSGHSYSQNFLRPRLEAPRRSTQVQVVGATSVDVTHEWQIAEQRFLGDADDITTKGVSIRRRLRSWEQHPMMLPVTKRVFSL